jgi:hypothetical protein
MKKKILILFILFISGVQYAQVFSGTTTAQFLKIEVGAKAIATGGAFVATANDASALYWNPAGISGLQNNIVSFTHTYWLANTSHDFAGLVLKLGGTHTIGISYTSLSYGDMKVRTEIYPEGTGEYFSSNDYALGLSYSFGLTDQFSIGVTGKYVGSKIWHMSTSAIAFDLGILYHTPIEGLNLGMSISNISSKMKFGGKDNFIYYTYDASKTGNSDNIFAEIKMDEWDLPLIYRVGLAMNFFKTDLHNFTVSVDANHPNDYNESVNVGMEYSFKERIFLRCGYKSLFKKESEEGITAGAGLIYYISGMMPLKADYAFAAFGRLNNVHRISVELGF